MTMTKSQATGDATGADVARNPADPTDVDAAVAARRPKMPIPHRNDVVVVGELTPPVEARERADGAQVLSFRVAVRSPTAGNVRDPASREPNPSSRRDILDCVVSSGALRRRLESYRPGDVLELAGSLRHRFWNTAGRVQSRYEIEVDTLKRLARDRTSRNAETSRE
jgi:single-strand DNA-binding protein